MSVYKHSLSQQAQQEGIWEPQRSLHPVAGLSSFFRVQFSLHVMNREHAVRKMGLICQPEQQ